LKFAYYIYLLIAGTVIHIKILPLLYHQSQLFELTIIPRRGELPHEKTGYAHMIIGKLEFNQKKETSMSNWLEIYLIWLKHATWKGYDSVFLYL